VNNELDLENDEVLLRELRATLEILDPPPDSLDDVITAAWLLRRPGLVVADLLSDSFDGELAGVRAAGGERVLTYGQGDVVLELVVDERRRAVLAHVIPPDGVRVQLLTISGDRELEVDEVGSFSVPEVNGPVRLAVFPPAAAPFTTPVLPLLPPLP